MNPIITERPGPEVAPAIPPGGSYSPPTPPELEPRPEDFPDLNEFVIEDGKPVDGILSEKQMRLLTEPLFASWSGPPGGQPFVVMANVGVFHARREPAIVPDVLLATGVTQGSDLTDRENLSYFIWLRGKSPDVVIEVVSNREGGEETNKIQGYSQIGVPYYVIFDPQDLLKGGQLRVYELRGRRYERIPEPWFFPEVGLGVCLWQGRFEDFEATWLRWCDSQRKIIPTGAECADQERQRADQERQRAEQATQELEQIKAQLKGMGIALPP